MASWLRSKAKEVNFRPKPGQLVTVNLSTFVFWPKLSFKGKERSREGTDWVDGGELLRFSECLNENQWLGQPDIGK